MKKSAILLLLLTASVTVFGQVKPKKHTTMDDPLIFRGAGTTATPLVIKPDTIYIIHEGDLNRLYQLLSAGMSGVSSSDNFSVNQRKLYQNEWVKLDSVLRPQLLKWHPVKKNK